MTATMWFLLIVAVILGALAFSGKLGGAHAGKQGCNKCPHRQQQEQFS